MPLPSVTFAVRPVMRTFKSASRIGGNPATGRSVAELPTISIDRPSSGIGGPLTCMRGNRRIGRNVHAFDGAADDMLHDPVANLRGNKRRPQPLERGSRHPVAGKTNGDPRVRAVVELAGQRDGDALVAPAAELLGADDRHARS